MEKEKNENENHRNMYLYAVDSYCDSRSHVIENK